ncbi:MAG: hypothetical protein RL662_1199 [Bacteroidota bacterium]|jgi:hypothetical protein
MRKKLLIILSVVATTMTYAQDQTINGNLYLAFPTTGSLRLGRIGDPGNTNVPLGAKTGQYNIDFSGYRDIVPDQIGARISAIRFNAFEPNKAYIQQTGLAFYTNGSGWESGTNVLKERLRITPNGNIGIGTENPKAVLDVALNSENTLKTVLARLPEGESTGEGTYLGAKSYYTQVIPASNIEGKVKLFSLEHKFYGQLNNSINFYRGGGSTGGYMGFGVDDGFEVCRLSRAGMEVAGTVRAKEVKVEATGWADYVFDADYKLPKLEEVEAHIKEHKHLPEIPSQAQVQENGVDLLQMQVKLLQKIEELTLYSIEQNKRIADLEKKLSNN